MARSCFPRSITTTAVEMRLNSDHVKAVFRSMAMQVRSIVLENARPCCQRPRMSLSHSFMFVFFFGCQQEDDLRNNLSYSLAFADDHDNADAWKFQVLSDPRMQSQLEKSRGQCIPKKQQSKTTMEKHVDNEPLPKTMSDALLPSRRAIVITESKAPFRIWNVNPAWEELCGYSFLESRGKTLGMIQGRETDTVAATNLISKLLQGEEEVGTELINYTSDGRRFTNRIRVGPIFDDQHKVTHFVGVLQEMRA